MIEVREVTKRFGTTTALAGVSMSADRGSVLGFLGPNGAGKSTMMKIITTFLAPDEGKVLVDGMDVMEDPLAVRRQIGYMPESVPLYPAMRMHEYLDFVGRARGLSGAGLKSRMEWVVETCGLVTEFKKPIRDLSKGFRQRTGLAQALIHDPEILILDEPTSGLDPLQIMEIRDLIHDLGETKTVIFSTHILQEVQPVTERVVIINQGKVIADGLISELKKAAMGSNRIFIGFDEVPAELEASLRALDGYEEILRLDDAREPGRFELRGSFDADLVGGVAAVAREKGWRLRELQQSPFSLEDTFIALIKSGEKRRKVKSAPKTEEVRA